MIIVHNANEINSTHRFALAYHAPIAAVHWLFRVRYTEKEKQNRLVPLDIEPQIDL